MYKKIICMGIVSMFMLTCFAAVSVVADRPNKPTIEGPTSGYTGVTYEYTFSATDPDGDEIGYYIDWGDDIIDSSSYSESGGEVKVSHTWTKPGDYTLRARAVDYDSTSEWESLDVLMWGYPPITPTIISGPQFGKYGTEYTYKTGTRDPDGHQIQYLFDWGDGTNSGWSDLYDSGDYESCEASHIWAEKGIYTTKVKARDEHGAESGWSDPLPVSMPRNRAINTPFLNFLQQHPHLFPILQQLFQRFLKL